MNANPQGYRACNGGPGGVKWCGKPATVVCTERDDGPRPLQWYACDDVEHRQGAHVEPIEAWFNRHGLPLPGPVVLNK